MISTNIRSLTKNLSQLKQIANRLKPNIITLSEIWRPYGPYVTLPDYNPMIINVRPPGKSGGCTAIYNSKLMKIINKVLTCYRI